MQSMMQLLMCFLISIAVVVTNILRVTYVLSIEKQRRLKYYFEKLWRHIISLILMVSYRKFTRLTYYRLLLTSFVTISWWLTLSSPSILWYEILVVYKWPFLLNLFGELNNFIIDETWQVKIFHIVYYYGYLELELDLSRTMPENGSTRYWEG